MPDGRRLAIEHRSQIPDPLVAEAKLRADDLRALLVGQPASRATNATLDALEAQRLLRQGRWPTMTPEECGFPVGLAGQTCKRCGASWAVHPRRSGPPMGASDEQRYAIGREAEEREQQVPAARREGVNTLWIPNPHPPKICKPSPKEIAQAAFLDDKFGPLTTGGKMCRRCLTIRLCRELVIGFVCDLCRRDDDKAASSTSSVPTLPVRPNPAADALLAYAVEKIQAVADRSNLAEGEDHSTGTAIFNAICALDVKAYVLSNGSLWFDPRDKLPDDLAAQAHKHAVEVASHLTHTFAIPPKGSRQ
jgi:hypothetical protein